MDDHVDASDELRDELRRAPEQLQIPLDLTDADPAPAPRTGRQIPIDLTGADDELAAASRTAGAGRGPGSYVTLRQVFGRVDRTKLYGGALAGLSASWTPPAFSGLSGIGRLMQNPLGDALDRSAFPLAPSGIDSASAIVASVGRAANTALLDPLDGTFAAAIQAQTAPIPRYTESVLATWSPTPTEIVTGALDQVVGSSLQDTLAALTPTPAPIATSAAAVVGGHLIDQFSAVWSTSSTATVFGGLADQMASTVISDAMRVATAGLIVGSVGEAFAPSGLDAMDWRRFAGIDPTAFTFDTGALAPLLRLGPDLSAAALLDEELRRARADLARLISEVTPRWPHALGNTSPPTDTPGEPMVVDQPMLDELRRATRRVLTLAAALASTGRRGASRTAMAWVSHRTVYVEVPVLCGGGAVLMMTSHEPAAQVLWAIQAGLLAVRGAAHKLEAEKAKSEE